MPRITPREVFIYPKNSTEDLADHLNAVEFACHCTYKECHFFLWSPKLKKAWNGLRGDYGAPLDLTNGFRCQKHNKDETGRDESYHTVGQSLDIDILKMGEVEINRLQWIAKRYFDYIEINLEKGYMHLHVI